VIYIQLQILKDAYWKANFDPLWRLQKLYMVSTREKRNERSPA